VLSFETMQVEFRDIYTIRNGEVFRYAKKWWIMDLLEIYKARQVGNNFTVLANGSKFDINYDEVVAVLKDSRGQTIMTSSREFH